MPGTPRPFDMNAHSPSGSDDEALRPPPESDGLAAEEAARPASHDPVPQRREWQAREQQEDESVAQILAGVSSSHAQPDVHGRSADDDRTVSPPPFLRSGPTADPQLCHTPDTAPCTRAAGVLRRFRGDRRI